LQVRSALKKIIFKKFGDLKTSLKFTLTNPENMTSKSDKGKKSLGKTKTESHEPEKKSSTKSKKQFEEDDDEDLDEDDNVETPAAKKGKTASSKKNASDEDDDDDGGEDEVDDWDKVEEEESWDPDFEEFDIPKSKAKKTAGKKGEEEEEDFKLDDEFKDMDLFNERGFDDDEEDDF
jgi:hypothetical protein